MAPAQARQRRITRLAIQKAHRRLDLEAYIFQQIRVCQILGRILLQPCHHPVVIPLPSFDLLLLGHFGARFGAADRLRTIE